MPRPSGSRRQSTSGGSRLAGYLICVLAAFLLPQIGPAFAETDNETDDKSENYLARTIRDELLADQSLEISELRVEVDSGKVLLKGRVPNLWHSSSAERNVSGRVGVRSVINLLQVEPDSVTSEGYQVESALDSSLTANPYLGGRSLTAAVSGEVAILFGAVNTRFEKEQAARAAERIPGVKYVDNRIVVLDNCRLAANEAPLFASSDPTVRALVESYEKSLGIDPDMDFQLSTNIAEGWQDSVYLDPYRPGGMPLFGNPETGHRAYFDVYSLGIAVGWYLIKKAFFDD